MIAAVRRRLYKVLVRGHNALMVKTDGRMGQGHRNGYTFLVLETVGARSGAARRTTLLCMPEGEGFLVLASNFGQEHPPSWLFNVQAQPDVQVVVDGSRYAMRAAVLIAADREAVIPAVTAYSSQWRRYLSTVERPIPIIRLSPR